MVGEKEHGWFARHELLFLVVWSCVLILIALTPHLVAYLTTPHGFRYLMTAYPSVWDTNSYFTWIRQATDGNWLFSLKYTSEQTPNLVFSPIFLTMGMAVRAGVALPVVWFGTQAVSIAVLVFSVWAFLRHFFPRPTHRLFALSLATLAGGFGWVFYFLNAIPPFSWRPVDISLSEATIARSLMWPFLFCFALSLLLLSFDRILRYDATGRCRHLIIAGLLGSVLTLIHPYDVVTLSAVAVIFLVVRKAWRSWKPATIFFAISAAPLLYYLSLIQNPIYAATSKATMFSPTFIAYLLGLGFLVPFVLAGFIFQVSGGSMKRNSAWTLAGIWLFVIPFLLYAPIDFQRRLVEGWIVPAAIFACVGMFMVWEKLRRASWFRSVVVRGLVIAGTVAVMAMSLFVLVKSDVEHVQTKEFPYFISDVMLNATKWLDEHTAKSDVVLSSMDFGNVIPRLSGNTVFVGHWAQTKDFDAKDNLAQAFFAGKMDKGTIAEFLRSNNIAYVAFGPEERNIGSAEQLNDQTMFRTVYENGSVRIYRVMR